MTAMNTPLTEVAKLLSPRTAKLLLDEPMALQPLYLSAIRTVLATWEEVGVVLDPITLERKLYELATRLVSKE